jgi:O-antigen/teichoic acid export membrane protein
MARSVWAGAGATLVSEAIGRGAAMGFQMLVANQLGADRFGIVALALASAAMLSPLADAGLPNLALRLVSEHPENDDLVHRLGGLKVVLTPLYLLPLFVWATRFPGGSDRSMALVWAGAFYGFQASSDLLRQILRARQQVGRELSARFAYPIGNLVALLAVWRLHPGPVGALLALASGPASLTIAYIFAYPAASRRIQIGLGTWNLIRKRHPLLLQSVGYLFVVGLATRVDAFLLEKYSGRAEVGRYFAALNLVMAGGFFAQGLSSYLYPRLHRQSGHRGRALLRAAGIQGLLGILLALVVAVAGPLVFKFVFRTHSFQGADALLPVLGMVLCLSTLDWLWFSVLIGCDKIWISTLNVLPVLCAKILLGPIWITRYGGEGMAWAALLGQAGTGLLGAVAAWRFYVRGGNASVD